MGVRAIAAPGQAGKTFSLTTSEKGYATLLLTDKAKMQKALQDLDVEIEKVCKEILERLGLPLNAIIELKGDKVLVVKIPDPETKPSTDADVGPPPAADPAAPAPTAAP